MATLAQKIAAERRIRELIEREQMPPPDRIEYGFTCIRLFWDGPKIVLVIDIDEPDEHDEQGARNDLEPFSDEAA